MDIPLGTAKSLIHRAREKLRDALAAYAAEEVAPMVQEVFNEHKLPPEFARRVLDGIADLSYRTSGETTLCGSVVACLEYMKEPVAYDFVMGVSGAAFKLLWHPDWCPSNNSMGILGEEPIRRTFRALGYGYELVVHTGDAGVGEKFRTRILESIDKGRPVIAWGIVGAPDEGIVTGYDRNGDVLFGSSYFHDGSKGYYEKEDWVKDCYGILLIGERTDPPPREQVLREALEWAVQLAHAPCCKDLPTAHGEHVNGLASYDVWAEVLRGDEDFPRDDMEKLTFRCLVSNSVTMSGLREARMTAVQFLRSMADAAGNARAHVLAAAAAFEAEEAIVRETLADAPCAHAPEEERLGFADPKLRNKLADRILSAKERCAEAIEHMEKALRSMSGG